MSESNEGATQRVIKKYPNRRLYDTDTSSYITLAEVKQLVMDSEPVVIKDAKTGEDLTRAILLQIILEEEAGGAPMFSEAMLANIIPVWPISRYACRCRRRTAGRGHRWLPCAPAWDRPGRRPAALAAYV